MSNEVLTKVGNKAEWAAGSSGGGGSSVPKPLTYDYMPEGYPTKSVQTITLMEEQELAFAFKENRYAANLTNAIDIVEGQTYTVNWDGTEYECVCSVFNSAYILGNQSFVGAGDDTGEPFLYMNNPGMGSGFMTLATSASHTISVKTTREVVTTMVEEFLPTIPADKLPTIPVIEFTTNILKNIANNTQPSFTVSNLSYSEIYALVEKGKFQIKDTTGVCYSPIKCSIKSSGSIFVDLLVIGTPTIYANLVCGADQNIFYRNSWWQIEATRK